MSTMTSLIEAHLASRIDPNAQFTQSFAKSMIRDNAAGTVTVKGQNYTHLSEKYMESKNAGHDDFVLEGYKKLMSEVLDI